MLAAAKKQREAIVKQEEAKKPDAPAARPSNPQIRQRTTGPEVAMQRIQGLIQAKDLEMDDYKKQSVELEKTIKMYQARMESVPVGIKEYDQLTRERDLAKKDYEDLDRRLNGFRHVHRAGEPPAGRAAGATGSALHSADADAAQAAADHCDRYRYRSDCGPVPGRARGR